MSIVEITVYPFINERVNRYTVIFLYILLTSSLSYGKMRLGKKIVFGLLLGVDQRLRWEGGVVKWLRLALAGSCGGFQCSSGRG